jgi:hypothetical protein
MRSLFAVVAISLASWGSPTAGVAETASGCIDAGVPRSAVTDRGGSWVSLTPGQWQFLRGVYAMNPNGPATLPYGDGAFLAEVQGNEDGLVFFTDGDRACIAILLPHELVDVLRAIAAGKIEHETAGL